MRNGAAIGKIEGDAQAVGVELGLEKRLIQIVEGLAPGK